MSADMPSANPCCLAAERHVERLKAEVAAAQAETRAAEARNHATSLAWDKTFDELTDAALIHKQRGDQACEKVFALEANEARLRALLVEAREAAKRIESVVGQGRALVKSEADDRYLETVQSIVSALLARIDAEVGK